jgi:hypothetical protein
MATKTYCPHIQAVLVEEFKQQDIRHMRCLDCAKHFFITGGGRKIGKRKARSALNYSFLDLVPKK